MISFKIISPPKTSLRKPGRIKLEILKNIIMISLICLTKPSSPSDQTKTDSSSNTTNQSQNQNQLKFLKNQTNQRTDPITDVNDIIIFLNCSQPLGRYICDTLPIDEKTQSYDKCQRGLYSQACRPLKNQLLSQICSPQQMMRIQKNYFSNDKLNYLKDLDIKTYKTTGNEILYYQTKTCRWTNGTQFHTTLLLSLFLGFLGFDRFYLGYPTCGLIKLLTCGMGGLWWLVDIILIAFQYLGPADGSDYVTDYWGVSMVGAKREL